MQIQRLLEFVATVTLFITLPGPSLLFVISRGVALGRTAALATVIGNAAGVSMQIALVAVGLGSVLASSVIVFTMVKFGGAAYLVFLGVQMVRHRRALAMLADAVEVPHGAVRILREGFVVGATNPKTLVIFTAVFPQFVDTSQGALQWQLGVLGAIYMVIAIVSDSVWAVASGTVRSWFRRSPRRLEYIGGAGGLVVIGLGLRLALSGRKD